VIRGSPRSPRLRRAGAEP